jgi:hypothetical protein
MPGMPWARRELLKAMSAGAATGLFAAAARDAAAQPVKWSEGTGAPLGVGRNRQRIVGLAERYDRLRRMPIDASNVRRPPTPLKPAC